MAYTRPSGGRGDKHSSDENVRLINEALDMDALLAAMDGFYSSERHPYHDVPDLFSSDTIKKINAMYAAVYDLAESDDRTNKLDTIRKCQFLTQSNLFTRNFAIEDYKAAKFTLSKILQGAVFSNWNRAWRFMRQNVRQIVGSVVLGGLAAFAMFVTGFLVLPVALVVAIGGGVGFGLFVGGNAVVSAYQAGGRDVSKIRQFSGPIEDMASGVGHSKGSHSTMTDRLLVGKVEKARKEQKLSKAGGRLFTNRVDDHVLREIRILLDQLKGHIDLTEDRAKVVINNSKLASDLEKLLEIFPEPTANSKKVLEGTIDHYQVRNSRSWSM